MSKEDISHVIIAGEHVIEYATHEFVDAIKAALSVKNSNSHVQSWTDRELLDWANS